MRSVALRSIEVPRGPSTADLVFDGLYRQVVALDAAAGGAHLRAGGRAADGQSRASRCATPSTGCRKLGLVQVQPQRATDGQR